MIVPWKDCMWYFCRDMYPQIKLCPSQNSSWLLGSWNSSSGSDASRPHLLWELYLWFWAPSEAAFHLPREPQKRPQGEPAGAELSLAAFNQSLKDFAEWDLCVCQNWKQFSMWEWGILAHQNRIIQLLRKGHFYLSNLLPIPLKDRAQRPWEYARKPLAN